MFANRKELGLHNSVQGHGVDGDTGALSDNDDERALKLEVDEKGNVIGTLLTLCQLSKDQKAAPSSAAVGQPHRLPDSSHWLEVAFCHAARAHDPESPHTSVAQENIRDDDSDGEDPLGNLERYLGLYLAGPLIEGEKVDGSEGIGGVNSAGDEGEDPEPGVGKGS